MPNETTPNPTPENPVEAPKTETTTETSTTTPGRAAAKPKKKSKTLWYVLGGCGGCLVLLIIIALILYFVVGGSVRKFVDDLQKAGSQTQELQKTFEEAAKEAEKASNEAKQAQDEAAKKAENLSKSTGGTTPTTKEVEIKTTLGIMDNVGNFTAKSGFPADVDNVSLKVTIVKAKPETKISAEWYDPKGNLLDTQNKTVGTAKELVFTYQVGSALQPGQNEYIVLVNDVAEVQKKFTVTEPVNQSGNGVTPTSLDPKTFDYKHFFEWSDEAIVDWAALDIDGDGLEEGCILSQKGKTAEFHVFVLDWNKSREQYENVFDRTYKVKTTRIMIKDWSGDGKEDFVLVHAEDSGYGTGIAYQNGQYKWVESNL